MLRTPGWEGGSGSPVVTTTGIGLATAKRFAAEGAKVIVTGRNRETLEAARKELGDRAEVIESDAADEKQIAQLFEGLAKTHRRLDVLFLNAGIARFHGWPLTSIGP